METDTTDDSTLIFVKYQRNLNIVDIPPFAIFKNYKDATTITRMRNVIREVH